MTSVRLLRPIGSVLVAVALFSLLCGCAGSGRRIGLGRISGYQSAVLPPPGILYSDFKAPQRDARGPLGTKKGSATVHSIGLPPNPWTGLLGWDLVSWGNASTEEAKRHGGIRNVTHVDYDFQMILMVYRRYTTEVYGN